LWVINDLDRDNVEHGLSFPNSVSEITEIRDPKEDEKENKKEEIDNELNDIVDLVVWNIVRELRLIRVD
jgi:hypothetical protein